MLLLDVMLPKIDGFTIAEKLKDKTDMPVIMITAKDAIDDKLLGFDHGVQDYIVKPFDLRELEARINSIFKRRERVTEYTF
jgi:DNA-binding response OmpR family regulator